MQSAGRYQSSYGLENHGIQNTNMKYWNLIFGVTVPVSCPNIPKEVLSQRSTWRNPAEYDAQAGKLANMFIENFKEYAGKVPARVVGAGPKI